MTDANDRLDTAQDALDSYRGTDPDKFDELNDAVIEAERDVSWWNR